MRGGWLGGVFVLAGCWRPNPGFIGEPPAETTGGSGSDASAGASTHVSSGTDTTTSASAGTSSGGSTGTIEPGTSTTGTNGTTGDPVGSSGTTGELSEQQRCDMAALDPNATIVLDMIVACTLADWKFGPSVMDGTTPTICPIEKAEVGIIQTPAMVVSESGLVFDKALRVGPRKGVTGVVEGDYRDLQLLDVMHPCFVTRIDYAPGAPGQGLVAQVIVRTSGLDDDEQIAPEMVMMMTPPIPHGAPTSIVVPIPAIFAGKKVDVVLVVYQEAGDGVAQPSLLLESPRVIDAG